MEWRGFAHGHLEPVLIGDTRLLPGGDNLIEFYTQTLSCFITAVVGYFLAKSKKLQAWRFIPIGFAAGPLILSMLFIYPKIRSENKQQAYHKYGLIIGIVFLLIWIGSFIYKVSAGALSFSN